MKAEIATLHERMAKGGDWRSFREEIALLHDQATTEEEFVLLLEAHKNLVAVGKYAFSEEKYKEILPITEAEYKLFLNKEAMVNGEINPAKLEKITRREVEAGRLEAEDSLRVLAKAGASVFGNSENCNKQLSRKGDWFFLGICVAAALSEWLSRIAVSPLWLIGIGLVAGWYINERERTKK